jgi:hypothetical protein
MSSVIRQTGPRGFLLWFKQQQPGLYQMVAPELPSLVPEIFTQTEQKLGALRAIYKDSFRRRSPQRLGDYCDMACFTDASSYISSAPVTVDYSAQLNAPISYTAASGAGTIDYSSNLSDTSGDLTGVTPDTPTLSTDGTTAGDVASAANTGTMGAGTANQIGSAISAAAGAVLTAGEIGLLGKAIQTQLLNAQQGLAPNSTINTAALGIPTVPAKTSSLTDILLIGAAAIAAYVVLS